MGLGKRTDGDASIGYLRQTANTDMGHVESKIRVDLVAHYPQIMAKRDFGDAFELFAGHDHAGWIVRRIQQNHARAFGNGGLELVRVQMKAAVHVQRHIHPGRPGSIDDALVGHVAGFRHQHLVTRLHQTKGRRIQAILCARTNHHLPGLDALPGQGRVPRHQRFTKFRAASESTVVRAPRPEACYRCVGDGRRRAEVRIADTQKNHVLAALLSLPGLVVNRPCVGCGGVQTMNDGSEFHHASCSCRRS
jgi:hypothetical protein